MLAHREDPGLFDPGVVNSNPTRPSNGPATILSGAQLTHLRLTLRALSTNELAGLSDPGLDLSLCGGTAWHQCSLLPSGRHPAAFKRGQSKASGVHQGSLMQIPQVADDPQVKGQVRLVSCTAPSALRETIAGFVDF